MTTESPQAAPSTPAPETPANPAVGAAAGQRDVKAMADEIARLRAEVERLKGLIDKVAEDHMRATRDAIERAEQAEAQLAKVADLVADAKRLDWLDTVNANMNAHSGTKYGWRYEINHIRAALTDCNYPPLTIREAIDEAMKRSEERSGR